MEEHAKRVVIAVALKASGAAEVSRRVVIETILGLRTEHRIRGTRYWVQAVGIRESDGEPLVVNRDKEVGTCWVRPFSEFMDGRFVRLLADG